MKKDLNNLVVGINNDLPEVQKALDTLAVTQVFTYAYLLLSEKIHLGLLNAESSSDFLKGAYAVLEEIQSLPDKLLSIK